MFSSKFRTFTVIFALLVFTGLSTVGCGQKTAVKQGWVNTASLPGQTFTNHSDSNAKKTNPAIISFDTGRSSARQNFGPRDVSFELQDLK